jgi:hypothetical protein
VETGVEGAGHQARPWGRASGAAALGPENLGAQFLGYVLHGTLVALSGLQVQGVQGPVGSKSAHEIIEAHYRNQMKGSGRLR